MYLSFFFMSRVLHPKINTYVHVLTNPPLPPFHLDNRKTNSRDSGSISLEQKQRAMLVCTSLRRPRCVSAERRKMCGKKERFGFRIFLFLETFEKRGWNFVNPLRCWRLAASELCLHVGPLVCRWLQAHAAKPRCPVLADGDHLKVVQQTINEFLHRKNPLPSSTTGELTTTNDEAYRSRWIILETVFTKQCLGDAGSNGAIHRLRLDLRPKFGLEHAGVILQHGSPVQIIKGEKGLAFSSRRGDKKHPSPLPSPKKNGYY